MLLKKILLGLKVDFMPGFSAITCSFPLKYMFHEAGTMPSRLTIMSIALEITPGM